MRVIPQPSSTGSIKHNNLIQTNIHMIEIRAAGSVPDPKAEVIYKLVLWFQ